VVGAVLRRKPYYRGLAFSLKFSKREILNLRDIVCMSDMHCCGV
jgi:hypothetical protein